MLVNLHAIPAPDADCRKQAFAPTGSVSPNRRCLADQLWRIAMDPILLAEHRAADDPDFSALLSEFLAALEHHGNFDLGRLYEISYDDFEILLGVLYRWRLQRFCPDVLRRLRPQHENNPLPS